MFFFISIRKLTQRLEGTKSQSFFLFVTPWLCALVVRNGIISAFHLRQAQAQVSALVRVQIFIPKLYRNPSNKSVSTFLPPLTKLNAR